MRAEATRGARDAADELGGRRERARLREGLAGRDSSQWRSQRGARGWPAGAARAPIRGVSRGVIEAGGGRASGMQAVAARARTKKDVEHARLALGPRAERRPLDLHLEESPSGGSGRRRRRVTIWRVGRESSEHEFCVRPVSVRGRAGGSVMHYPTRESRSCAQFTCCECESVPNAPVSVWTHLPNTARTRGDGAGEAGGRVDSPPVPSWTHTTRRPEHRARALRSAPRSRGAR